MTDKQKEFLSKYDGRLSLAENLIAQGKSNGDAARWAARLMKVPEVALAIKTIEEDARLNVGVHSQFDVGETKPPRPPMDPMLGIKTPEVLAWLREYDKEAYANYERRMATKRVNSSRVILNAGLGTSLGGIRQCRLVPTGIPCL